jgi:uncharacterized protein (TIGR03437 family)
MRRIPIVFFLALGLRAQPAQSPAGTVAGFGYRNTSPVMEAAPGQVVIVSLHGAKARLSRPVAGAPVPPALLATTVTGFSAELVQEGGRTPVGIYGVSQSSCPATLTPCAAVTNVTLQIPFELVSAQGVNGYAGLEIKEQDAIIAHFPLRAVSDKVHVVNSCDESVIYYSVFGGQDLEACTAAVVRPRGGLITPRNPVRPGEPLVAFAYGMGDANPSPAYAQFRPGLTKQPFILRYAVAGGHAFWAQAPDGVALTVPNGTYQIHFTVPPMPDNPPLPACGQLGVYCNVRVSISGMHSTDSFELCVQP